MFITALSKSNNSQIKLARFDALSRGNNRGDLRYIILYPMLRNLTQNINIRNE